MSRPLTLIPGGGGTPGQVRPLPSHVAIRDRQPLIGHPSVPFYDQDTAEPAPKGDSLDVLLVPLTRWQVSLIIGALGRAFQQSPQRGYVDMATELRHVMSKPLFTADECNARGIPRPGGVA